jgi:transcriptional regulator with XRE-family HTH domain
MPVSPSSSAQRARQDLAVRLREIRLDAGLTARALSAAAGWHEAKTSRIESAQQAPSDADIRAWCKVTGSDTLAPDIIAASRAADSMYTEWRRIHRAGVRRAQESRVPLYERTQAMRVYCPNVIPGLLQTADYARELLSAIIAFRDVPNDLDAAVAARMGRSRILGQGGRFAFIVEESVLRYQLGNGSMMAAQLGHLLSVMTAPSVSLGVIPFAAAGRSMWPVEAFTVFDDSRVHVELLSAQVTVTAPGEIVLYLRAFDALKALAVYGTRARALIASAIDALN